MKTRYYSFFAIMRMSISNKKLYFSAPGNKVIHRILILLRERGLIGGFSLDLGRKNLRQGYWHGYPKYKVFLKYSYLGFPVIKKFNCYKLTRTNFTRLLIKKDNYFTKIKNNDYYLITSRNGINVINNNELAKLPLSAKILAKIKI